MEIEYVTEKDLRAILLEVCKSEKPNCGSMGAYQRLKGKVSDIGLTSKQYETAIKYICNYLKV
jgi:hypothetical protein